VAGTVAEVYANGTGSSNPAVQEANARLIAAAPDLYAASQSTVDRMADLSRFLKANGNAALAEIIEEELLKHRIALSKAHGEG
jgi:hypothetical protein